MATKTISQLVLEIFFDNKKANKSIDLTEKIVNNFKNRINQAIIGIGTGAVFKNMLSGFVNAGMSLARLSMQTGENINTIQAWQSAVEKTGGSVDNFNSTIKALNEGQQELSRTGTSGALATMLQLGINAYNSAGKLKGATELIKDFAEKTKSMSDQQAFMFGKAMGIDEDTLFLIRDSGSALSGIIEKERLLAVYSKQNSKQSKEYINNLAQLNQLWRTLSRVIVERVLPVINLLIQKLGGFISFLIRNKPLLYAVLTGFASILVAVVGTAIISLTKTMGLFILKIIAMNIALLANPIVWIVGAIALAIAGAIYVFKKYGAEIKIVFDKIRSVLSPIIWVINKITEGIKFAIRLVSNFKNFTNPMGGINLKKTINYTPFTPSIGGIPVRGKSANNTSNISIGKIEVNSDAKDSAGLVKNIKNSFQQNPLVNMCEIGGI